MLKVLIFKVTPKGFLIRHGAFLTRQAIHRKVAPHLALLVSRELTSNKFVKGKQFNLGLCQ